MNENRSALTTGVTAGLVPPSPTEDAYLASHSPLVTRHSDIAPPAPADAPPDPQPLNPQSLASNLRSDLNSHCHLPPGADVAIVLWVLHTYVHKVRAFSPLLAITSHSPECGKSTLLRWLSTVVASPNAQFSPSARRILDVIKTFHPLHYYFDGTVRENLTTSPEDDPAPLLPRPPALLSRRAPTLLLDNVERIHPDLRDIFISGHCEYDACVGMPKQRPRSLAQTCSTWCPKALARIGPYPDLIADRSILIHLETKPAALKLKRVSDKRPNYHLTNQINVWAEGHAIAIELANPEPPLGVGNRLADNWDPLLAIADILGGEWPALARQSLLQLQKSADEAAGPDTRILAAIRDYFSEIGYTHVFTHEILDWLNAKRDATEPRKSKLGARQLADYLRQFRILTNLTIRRKDEVAKGYKLESFTLAFARFLSPVEEPRLRIASCNEFPHGDVVTGGDSQSQIDIDAQIKPAAAPVSLGTCPLPLVIARVTDSDPMPRIDIEAGFASLVTCHSPLVTSPAPVSMNHCHEPSEVAKYGRDFGQSGTDFHGVPYFSSSDQKAQSGSKIDLGARLTDAEYKPQTDIEHHEMPSVGLATLVACDSSLVTSPTPLIPFPPPPPVVTDCSQTPNASTATCPLPLVIARVTDSDPMPRIDIEAGFASLVTCHSSLVTSPAPLIPFPPPLPVVTDCSQTPNASAPASLATSHLPLVTSAPIIGGQPQLLNHRPGLLIIPPKRPLPPPKPPLNLLGRKFRQVD